jgi:hypothetical protein
VSKCVKVSPSENIDASLPSTSFKKPSIPFVRGCAKVSEPQIPGIVN